MTALDPPNPMCTPRCARLAALTGAMWLALLAAGCAPTRTSAPGKHQPYTGPTEPMAAVVARINANNLPIRTLWANIDLFEAQIYDAKHPDGTFVNGRGVINFRKPRDLLMQGFKEATKVFELGSNDQRYWTILPPSDTMWWGYYRNLGKPCVSGDIPVRPDAILEVLGIGDINTDLLAEPAPTMRFNPDADAYMFVFSSRGGTPPRWIASKEIWYDRQTLLPTLVLLFDENGRVVLRAYLSDYQPLEVPGLPSERWPKVARYYQLYFPDSLSRMWFRLTDVALRHGKLPNDLTFGFPTERANVSNIIQLDEGCNP